jgi:predicted RNase H-like HicB family nuclease
VIELGGDLPEDEAARFVYGNFESAARKEDVVNLKVRIYKAEEGGFWAKVPAIPGCVSQGETLDEVKANILDALEGCLAVREELALEEGRAIEELVV